MPLLSLIKRLVKGFPITPAEEDNNKTLIENAINGFQAQLAAALNPDGTLKTGSVSTDSIQDRAVTLRKLAFLSSFYAIDTGAANALVIAFTPALPAFVEGLVFYVKVAASNSGATTLAVDAVAAKAIKKFVSSGITPLVTGDLIAGGEYLFVSDGTQFILLNPTPPASGSTVGPVFLAITIPVYPAGGAVTWADFDASGSVPPNAKAVILQCVSEWSTSTDGEIVTQIRPDAGGPTLTLNRAGATDAVVNATQGIFPITVARHFQYQVTSSVVGSTSKIDLIGYIL
ncbi:MAG: hypothetical protein ABIW79_00295 [Gemmatimonas sp.]